MSRRKSTGESKPFFEIESVFDRVSIAVIPYVYMAMPHSTNLFNFS